MPAPATYEDLARIIDHTLLSPELTDEQVVAGLHLARRYGVGCVLVRPCDIDLAVRTLQGSSVRPGAVCGYPHSIQNTATKLYEGRDLLRRGAREIDMTIALPKLLSREFQHVQTELLQMSESCHKEGAVLKVMIEHRWLTEELKIIGCRCCERAEVDFVSTNAADDLGLLRKHVPEEVGVKADDVGSLDQALEAIALGATRIGTPATAEILDEWEQRLAAVSTAG